MPLEQPPVFSSYLDADQDLKPWLSVSHLTGMEAQVQLANDFACEWVQSYIKGPVAPTQITEYLSGDSGNHAEITLRYRPIISVTSVMEYYGQNGVHALTEQTPTNQTAIWSYQVDYLEGTLIRTVPGLTPVGFYPGVRNIVAEYTAGYETVPQAIKVATLEFARYWFKRTFDPRATKTDSDTDSAQLWPGIPNRVVELLSPYRTPVFA